MVRGCFSVGFVLIFGGSFCSYITLDFRLTPCLQRWGYPFTGLLFFVGLFGVSSAFGRNIDVRQKYMSILMLEFGVLRYGWSV